MSHLATALRESDRKIQHSRFWGFRARRPRARPPGPGRESETVHAKVPSCFVEGAQRCPWLPETQQSHRLLRTVSENQETQTRSRGPPPEPPAKPQRNPESNRQRAGAIRCVLIPSALSLLPPGTRQQNALEAPSMRSAQGPRAVGPALPGDRPGFQRAAWAYVGAQGIARSRWS